MSESVKDGHSLAISAEVKDVSPQAKKGQAKNYNGFVAGVFSGIAKLSVGCVSTFFCLEEVVGVLIVEIGILSTRSKYDCKQPRKVNSMALLIVSCRPLGRKVLMDCTKVRTDGQHCSDLQRGLTAFQARLHP